MKPGHAERDQHVTRRQGIHYLVRRHWPLATLLLALSLGAQLYAWLLLDVYSTTAVPLHAQETIEKCKSLSTPAGPPPDFHSRASSDRYESGTPPVLLKNGTVWTGGVSGFEVIIGDLLLANGLIQSIGNTSPAALKAYGNELVTVDLHGAWVTPGIVDLHSHLGVYSSPALSGARDGNSHAGLVNPWLRSLDALNTHDDAYRLAISGGLTTAVILPGSANAIGGQAFGIKLRPTKERSPTSMLLEPPHSIINGTKVDPTIPPRWRLMKQACGENPSRVYSGTRMDTIWAFRQAYDTAKKIKQEQDDYCEKALAGKWEGLGHFPDDLKWEMLVDVLRGHVKIHNHCYESVDLDDIVRLTNEFHFSIAAFHHAHEAYLVPDVLKRAWGKTPAIAMFGSRGRFKREAYRGSEFAPRILSADGIRVVLKSDHPVTNSRNLLYEAQQAFYYGLSSNLALASITTTPAEVMGQDHRIGSIKLGYDADIVVWDSHPLTVGATPSQVFIDGIAQLENPFFSSKPSALQKTPKSPNFDAEAAETVKHEGLPPLEVQSSINSTVIFKNLSLVAVKNGNSVHQVFPPEESALGEKSEARGIAVIQNGKLVCGGLEEICFDSMDSQALSQAIQIDLDGGSITPSFVGFGSALGLSHIGGEASTKDGSVFDPLTSKAPSILGGDEALIRASDGLLYGTRDALLAYRGGVSTSIAVPEGSGLVQGLTAAFSTASAHKLEPSALLQDVTAIHITLSFDLAPSVSSQIAALRRLLNGGGSGELGKAFDQVGKGELPLIIAVESADIMASLVLLKRSVEDNRGSKIEIVFTGATEAHLLAKELGEAQIGVILSPSRPFPGSWEQKRLLPGPPLSETNAVAALLNQNVTVAIGVPDISQVRHLRFDLAWAALEAGGEISRASAIALGSTNLEKLLGVKEHSADLVATKGGTVFDYSGKIIGIASAKRACVDIF